VTRVRRFAGAHPPAPSAGSLRNPDPRPALPAPASPLLTPALLALLAGALFLLAAARSLLMAHQDSRYEEWGFTGSVRFDPGLSGRGLSLTMTPSFGMASQGAHRLWAMQDMGGLVPHGARPLDMGGQFAADVGYGMAGPGGRGTGTPYAGLTQSAVGYRALRFGWRWTVDQRFNVGVEGVRQAAVSGTFDGGNSAAGLGRSGDAAHSVQVRDGVSF